MTVIKGHCECQCRALREYGEAAQVTVILLDLIAELRHHCGEVCRCDIAQSADRAEARLREVRNEG